jgi:diguanylate cyclase (GGDEF)-like protein
VLKPARLVAAHARTLVRRWGLAMAAASAVGLGLAVGAVDVAGLNGAARLAVGGLAAAGLGLIIYFAGCGAVLKLFDRAVTIERRRCELLRARARRARERIDILDAALNHMTQGLSMFDGNERLVVFNDTYATLYSLSPDRIYQGMSLREIMAARQAHGVTPVQTSDRYLQDHNARVARGGTDNRIQELSDGRLMAVSHRQLPDGGWFSIHDDVTEKHRAERQIAYMATHDALTDLPNRLQLWQHLEGLQPGARRGQAFAVLYLDLDHFKHVNDTLGHPLGDALLKAVAVKLCNCVRETDLVARLGGDEFAIIQTGIHGQAEASILAKRIVEALSHPFTLQDLQVSSGLSIGIAISPVDGTEPHELVKKADLALYRAKNEGRGVWRFFEPEMDARAQQRRKLETGLRQALAESQIEVHYQPVVDMEGTIRCFEALARWRHPERGLVPPGEFIPVAEETGLIVPLGELVLRLACARAATWPDGIKVAVNLSPAQFRSNGLGPTVVSALGSAGLSARRLELEITESLLMQSHEDVLATMHQLRALGISISMDDFGTGYSSLSYLRRFPFDKIKIDRSFIKDITISNDCLAIVRAVASLGRSLGIMITAEGVETAEQLERVREEGCSEAQGYLISPPLPAEAVEPFLNAHAPAPLRLGLRAGARM